MRLKLTEKTPLSRKLNVQLRCQAIIRHVAYFNQVL